MARMNLQNVQQLCDEHEEDTQAQAWGSPSESEESQRQWEEAQDRAWAEEHQQEMEDRERQDMYEREMEGYDPYDYSPFDLY